MGYRNYLYIVEKNKLNKIKNLTYDEASKRFGHGDGDPFLDEISIIKYCNGKEIFEFGKYLDWTDDIRKYMSDVFKDVDVCHYLNFESEFVELDCNALPIICEVYRKKILNYYNKLMSENNVNVLHNSIHNIAFEWETIATKPVNDYSLTYSCRYEYDYFNLLYLMTKINKEKQVLLWIGY